VRPVERMAARTRSRASRTDASGSPTMVNPGSPFEMWTSTETGHPTAPLSAAEATVASMRENGRIGGARGPALFRDRSPRLIRDVSCLRPAPWAESQRKVNLSRWGRTSTEVLGQVFSTLISSQKPSGQLPGPEDLPAPPATNTALERVSPTTRCRSSRRTTERCRVRRRWQPGRSPSRHSVRRCRRRSSRCE
jgi:hypothetical protein